MTALGWGLASLPLILAVYAYVAYPAILWALARRPSDAARSARAKPPLVTVVVPAYNEEAQIRGAIEAILAQKYPADRRQILVLSDASTDATDDIVREYSARGVELLRMPARAGKTAAENSAARSIRGEIVVNTDASVRLQPDALPLLVAAMADASVGVASTRDISVTRAGNANPAEAGYVGYEMRIRALETRTGGIVGASGSGYAIRAELHRKPVREDLSRDFSAALTAWRAGFRSVSVDAALCAVPRTASLGREYRRKVRTISRGMETLYFNRDLLDLVQHREFAWKLVSHKLCRWLVPLSTLPAAVGLLLLTPSYPWMWYVLASAALLLIVVGLTTRWSESRLFPSWIPVSVLGTLTGNLAVLHAAGRFWLGHHDHIWEPTRRTEPGLEEKRSEPA